MDDKFFHTTAKRVTENGAEPSIDGIFTVGYGNRDFETFAKLLVENNIKVLIDVRREGSRGWSPLYTQGYRHMADRLLRLRPHDKAIHYVAAPEFGNTFDSLEEYDTWLHSGKGAGIIKSWVYLFDSYMHLGWNPCLMCCELKAIKDNKVNCHRVLIAEYLKERLLYWTGYKYKIIHL